MFHWRSAVCVVEVVKQTAPREKLVSSPALGDLTVAQDDEVIAKRQQPAKIMIHYHDGVVFGRLTNHPQDPKLFLIIHSNRRFVEKENRGIAEQAAG